MPDPIVMPTTTVIAPKRPRRRGRPSLAVALADMRLWYCATHLGASRDGHDSLGTTGLVDTEDSTPQRLNRGLRRYTFRRDFRPRLTRLRRWFDGPRPMMIRSAMFWIAAACCVIAELAILRSLLFGRARAAERAMPGTPVARTTRPTEIAWALLPAAGLLLVLYLTWRAVDAPATPSSDANRIGTTIGA